MLKFLNDFFSSLKQRLCQRTSAFIADKLEVHPFDLQTSNRWVFVIDSLDVPKFLAKHVQLPSMVSIELIDDTFRIERSPLIVSWHETVDVSVYDCLLRQMQQNDKVTGTLTFLNAVGEPVEIWVMKLRLTQIVGATLSYTNSQPVETQAEFDVIELTITRSS